MKSSTNQISNSSSIHENQSDVRIPHEQIGSGVYLARNGISVVLEYENDNPKAIEAFEGSEAFEIMIKSVNGIDMFAMKFSNGLCFASDISESYIKSECMPDISRRGPDFRMPCEIIWTDSATNKILKNNLAYLSPENTEHLCIYLATRMIYQDKIGNCLFVRFENRYLLDMIRRPSLRHDWPVSQ